MVRGTAVARGLQRHVRDTLRRYPTHKFQKIARHRYRCEHRDPRIADVRSSSRTSIKVPPDEAFVQEFYPPRYRRSDLVRGEDNPVQQIQVLRKLLVKLT